MVFQASRVPLWPAVRRAVAAQVPASVVPERLAFPRAKPSWPRVRQPSVAASALALLPPVPVPVRLRRLAFPVSKLPLVLAREASARPGVSAQPARGWEPPWAGSQRCSRWTAWPVGWRLQRAPFRWRAPPSVLTRQRPWAPRRNVGRWTGSMAQSDASSAVHRERLCLRGASAAWRRRVWQARLKAFPPPRPVAPQSGPPALRFA